MAIELDELRRVVAAADPSAIVVPDRILRRVIRQHGGLRRLGSTHPSCYAIPGAALAAIVDGPEVGRPADLDWPEIVRLIAPPEIRQQSATEPGPVLTEAWRRLFRVRVLCELTRSLESGAIDAAGLAARIEAIGRMEFDEARTVLRQDGQLLSPATDASAYAAFAAVFLELGFFDRAARSWVFPAIESVESIESILARDVDGRALLAATRPTGAPEPMPPSARTGVSDESSQWDLSRDRKAGESRESGAEAKVAERARVASESGNHVRAAILWTRAARRAGPAAGRAERAAARAALNRLAVRLRKALFVQKGESSLWVGALTPLLENAAAGFWTPERRLLHDLQNVCLDHEREVFRLEPLAWLFSMGRRPLRHPLPHLREVTMSKHLRSASRRLSRARLDRDRRSRLEGLLDAAGRRADEALRERFRRQVDAALETTWVPPANLPERVAYRKLVEEMLDPIVARGFTTLGDLRDAASRGNLKMNDLASAGEFLRGDPLLRSDRRLAHALDGVHRRGEVYLRWLQRVSALAFGTSAGRFLTLFLALPFGGAFVLLKGLEEIYEVTLGHLTGNHVELVHTSSVLLLGIVALGVINYARFRRGFLAFLGSVGRTLRMVLMDLPARLLNHPLLRRLAASAPAVAAWRYALKPGLVAAPVLVAALAMRFSPMSANALGLIAFSGAFLAFNTRSGRRLEEWVIEGLTRAGHGLLFAVIPGLFHLIMSAFDRLIEWVERLIYAVDEWLRFREGQSGFVLAIKAVLGLFWGVVAYLVRIYLVLLVEPQLNPIKHFPVVTVAAKLLLPVVLVLPGIIAAPIRPYVGRVIADSFAATTVFFLPGVFGFLVWELRSNWRLYAANRPATLRPLAVGSHGETVVRFLRPAFHSGTLPKRFARLRQAMKAGRDRAAAKHREALHHVEEAMHRLVERDFAGLLHDVRSLADWAIEPGSIRLATNRIRFELLAAGGDRPSLWVDLEERDGVLSARIWRAGWIEGLDHQSRRVVGDALAGLYKVCGVERVQPAGVEPAKPGTDASILRADSSSPPWLDLAHVEIPWREWVAEWEKMAKQGEGPDGPDWLAVALPSSFRGPGLASTP